MFILHPLIKKQLIHTFFGLPLGLCIPYVAGSVWTYFADQSHNGGGMFYFPETIPEAIAFIFFVLSTAPAFIAFLFVGYMSAVLEPLGFPPTWSVLFSFSSNHDSIASIVVTLFILFCQSAVYGGSITLVVHIKQRVRQHFQHRAMTATRV